MGRPFDAVAAARRARPTPTMTRRAAAFDVVAAAVGARPGRARRRGPALDRRRQRQPDRPHRPAAVAEPRDASPRTAPPTCRAAQPGGELVLRLERRHEVEQVRLDRLDRTEVGGDGRGDLAGRRAVVGRSSRRSHRRSGGVPFVVEELMRVVGPRRVRRRPARGRAAVVARGGGAPAARRARRTAAARRRRGARRVRPGGVVRGAARRHRGSDEPDLLDALRGARRRRRRRRGQRRPVLVLPRPRRRRHRRTSCSAASGGGCTSAASRPCAGAPVLDHAVARATTPGAGRHDEVAGDRPHGRARGTSSRGSTFQALRLAAEGLAEAPNDPELLAVATEAAWRLDFVAEALDTAVRWAKVAVEPVDRIEALRFVARLAPRARRRGRRRGARWPSSRSWLRRRSTTSAARRGGVVAGPAAHDRRRSTEAVDVGRAGARRRPRPPATAHRGAGAGRAGRAQRRSGSRRPRGASTDAATRRSTAARRVGDAVLLTRAINNGLELVPPHSRRGRGAARRDAGASARASASTSSARRRRCCGRSRPRTATATCHAAPGRCRGRASGGAAAAHDGVVVGAASAFALEEGRLSPTPPSARPACSTACPATKTPALPAPRCSPLAAARGDRAAARAAFERAAGVAAAARHRDRARTTCVVLVEELLDARHRRRTTSAAGCSAAGSPSTRRTRPSGPTPRGCWRSPRATTTRPRRPSARCSPSPTRASPSR